MLNFSQFMSEAYSFIPKSSADIRNSVLPTKEKVAKLFDLIQSKTDNKMEDPIAISFNAPNRIKISRSLFDLDLPELRKETGLTLSFGDGSRGNRGASNRGIAFEKYLSKDIGLYIKSRSLEDDYKYPKFMKYFISKYLQNAKIIDIQDEGGLNKKRPIIFSGRNILIGGEMSDIGSVVTDITLTIDDTPMYLSLKMGSKVTLFNSGITKVITKSDIESGEIKNKNALQLLKLLGIEPDKLIDVFASYDASLKSARSNKTEVNVTSHINKSELAAFLASGLGYGYHMIHTKNISSDNITDLYIQKENVKRYTTPNSIIVKYPEPGKAKRIDVIIDTPKFEFLINIRSKTGGVYPTHILCDYKVKH